MFKINLTKFIFHVLILNCCRSFFTPFRNVEIEIDLPFGDLLGVDAKGVKLILELVHEALELLSIDGHAHVSEHLFQLVQQVIFPVVGHRSHHY